MANWSIIGIVILTAQFLVISQSTECGLDLCFCSNSHRKRIWKKVIANWSILKYYLLQSASIYRWTTFIFVTEKHDHPSEIGSVVLIMQSMNYSILSAHHRDLRTWWSVLFKSASTSCQMPSIVRNHAVNRGIIQFADYRKKMITCWSSTRFARFQHKAIILPAMKPWFRAWQTSMLRSKQEFFHGFNLKRQSYQISPWIDSKTCVGFLLRSIARGISGIMDSKGNQSPRLGDGFIAWSYQTVSAVQHEQERVSILRWPIIWICRSSGISSVDRNFDHGVSILFWNGIRLILFVESYPLVEAETGLRDWIRYSYSIKINSEYIIDCQDMVKRSKAAISWVDLVSNTILPSISIHLWPSWWHDIKLNWKIWFKCKWHDFCGYHVSVSLMSWFKIRRRFRSNKWSRKSSLRSITNRKKWPCKFARELSVSTSIRWPYLNPMTNNSGWNSSHLKSTGLAHFTMTKTECRQIKNLIMNDFPELINMHD